MAVEYVDHDGATAVNEAGEPAAIEEHVDAKRLPAPIVPQHTTGDI